MKIHFFVFSLIAGIVINQGAFAQQEQTTESLVIDSAIDFAEANVDRMFTYDGSISGGAAVQLNVVGASYTGTDVNLSVDYPAQTDNDTIYGVRLNNAKSIDLKTSGEDIWNTITVSSDRNQYGVYLSYATEVSHISNTNIDCTGGGSVYGILSQVGGDLELDNVNVHISQSTSNLEIMFGIGVHAVSGLITNEGKGQVTIVSDFTKKGDAIMVSSAIVSQDGIVDFHDATISVAQTGTKGLPYGVLTAMSSNLEASIFLKDSRIASSDGNVLAAIVGQSATSRSIVNLDHVDLSNAKNQAIIYEGESYLNLSNGTNLDGYLEEYAESDFTLAISSGASWNVTQDSTTGATGSLSLGAESTISFVELSEGTFTNITSASIALEAGAILMLGATAEEIQALMDGNEGTYDVKLFTTDNKFSNDGVVLVTSDGQELEYTTDNLGTYTLMSILPASIPEPTTTSFGLAALGLLALRRRK